MAQGILNYKGISVIDPTGTGPLTNTISSGNNRIFIAIKALADRVPTQKLNATTDPTVGWDGANTSGQGTFYVGSIVLNTSTNSLFYCADNSTGAAVWLPYAGDAAAQTLQAVTDAGATTTDTIGLGGAIFTGGGTATITSDGDGGLNFTDEGGKILNWNFWDQQGLSIFGAALCLNNASGTGGSTLFLDAGTIQAGSGGYLVDDVNGGWIFGAGGNNITIDAGTLQVNANLQAGNGSFSNLAISSGDLNYDYTDSNFSSRVISVSGANSGSISNLFVASQIQGPSSFEVDGSGNISGNSFFGPTVTVSAGFYANNGSNNLVIDNNSNATFSSISAASSSMPQSGGNYNIDSGGNATFANFSGSSSGTNTGDQTGVNGINTAATQTTINGGTSGTAVCTMPFQGTSCKKVIIYCAALLGAAVYTFPTAFTHAPSVLGSLSGIAVATTTQVTLTGTTSTGFLVIEGF